MFIFGALLTSERPHEESILNMADRHAHWLSKIRDITPTCVITHDRHILFCGSTSFVKKSDDDSWFLNENTKISDTDTLYSVAYGHPASLSAIRKLTRYFLDIDKNKKALINGLVNINTEFILFVFAPKSGSIFVITDKLGIVPAYIYRHNSTIYFSTAQWPLKLTQNFEDVPDWQGISEKLIFRSSLDDRTIHKSIKRVGSGLIKFLPNETKSCIYYRLWENNLKANPNEVTSLLVQGFKSAVSDRLNNSLTAYSTLSGGLDSRTVVTELSKHGKRLITFNFAGSGTLDHLLSTQYAKSIHVEHYHAPSFALYYPNFSILSRAAIDSIHPEGLNVPKAVWTGDDGSISIGFVYMRREILNSLKADSSNQVAEVILKLGRMLPSRVLNKRWADEFGHLALEGVAAWLKPLEALDQDKKYYCFLLLNRVRRMFDLHFETAHLHNIHLCMPFLDVRTIEPVLSSDMPECSEHRLYLKFARKLDHRILGVPWQSYPGHEPCPLPLPEGRSQWHDFYNSEEKKYLRQKDKHNLVEVLNTKLWQGKIRKEMLAAFLLRDWIGLEPTGGIANTLYDLESEHDFTGMQ